jgi:hypothetical protein
MAQLVAIQSRSFPHASTFALWCDTVLALRSPIGSTATCDRPRSKLPSCLRWLHCSHGTCHLEKEAIVPRILNFNWKDTAAMRGAGGVRPCCSRPWCHSRWVGPQDGLWSALSACDCHGEKPTRAYCHARQSRCKTEATTEEFSSKV